MGDTVFSRIIRGELPCHKVYEDDAVIAFLDSAPLSRGHTLVVPKEPAETLADLSDPAAAGVGRALPRICRAVCKVTGATSYNILQNNGADASQSVPHVHFHVIPRTRGADTGPGLEMDWTPTVPDTEAQADLARYIARLL